MKPSLAHVGAALAVAAGTTLAGCTPKEPAQVPRAVVRDHGHRDRLQLPAVQDRGNHGPVTFNVTNNGSKVTEFYVYDKGRPCPRRVENIGSGISRKLIVQFTEPGTYQTACKPGMIGDGIRGDFTITGAAVKLTPKASSRTPPTATAAT